MANSYDLDIYCGSTFSTRLTARDSSQNAINLSGYSVRAYIKGKFSDTGILLNLNPIIYSQTSGIVDIIISGSQTAGLPIGQYPYDLEAYQGDYVVKFLRGYANFYPESTY
jgi:hypothetical protein